MGLVKNIECSLLIKDTKGEHSVHKAFYDYWKSILDGTEVNLYPITQELIDQLLEDKIITAETERAERYDNGRDRTTHTVSGKLEFKGTTLQNNPAGFSPKRRQVKAKRIIRSHNAATNTEEVISVTNETISVNGEEVLIAEIDGGPRWKQVNFPVNIFENFFGAERGNNTYAIKLMNIAKDGSLGKLETRQAVSVKSHNYRFEINCKETQEQYPGKEKRPIGLFVKVEDGSFLYQVILANHPAYERIKNYLYAESNVRREDELRRHIVHIEAIRALYPELIN